MTELELWALVRAAIEREAGERIPVLADLVAGPRTAEVGGPPGDRVLAEGDLVLCDLVPRRRRLLGRLVLDVRGRRADRRARAAGIALRRTRSPARSRPFGPVSSPATSTRWRAPASTTRTTRATGSERRYHEEPRIVPGSTVVLEPGMVIALEPGSYGDGEGVRVEQIVLVTDDGCEVLSGHDLAL